MKPGDLNLWFDHGLGDCANFAHVLELYRRRGFCINLHCADDKAVVFECVGVNRVPIEHKSLQYCEYLEDFRFNASVAGHYRCYNKVSFNISRDPLPYIGSPEALWDELCSIQLNPNPFIPVESRKDVTRFLQDLPRPIVLLHSMGNTSQFEKNLRPEVIAQLCQELLREMRGTLILLDWDNRVPRYNHPRVRHMQDDWHSVEVETLLALLQDSDLLISVDSGPLHLARFTDIPVVGIYNMLRVYPARMLIPRPQTINLVPEEITWEFNRHTRDMFNIVECPGSEVSPTLIARVAIQMLGGSRYLGPGQVALDVHLQQFLRCSEAAKYWSDRLDEDIAFQEISRRFDQPLFVISDSEPERGTSKSSSRMHYALGRIAKELKGEWIAFGPENSAGMSAFDSDRSVNIRQSQDPAALLARLDRLVDVLYLDSAPRWGSASDRQVLRELKATARFLGQRSLVILPETRFRGKTPCGKGHLAARWLISQGWTCCHGGDYTAFMR